MKTSFLQTREWLDFQNHVGNKTWVFNDGKIKANIIRHDMAFGQNYLYIPHGPEIYLEDIKGGIQNEIKGFISYITKLARENKSIFIKIEPFSDIVMELMYRRGFMRSSKHIQPQKTVVVNLNLSEEELLSRMHQKTRYNINLATKKGMAFKEKNDVQTFWKLLKKTAEADNFHTHSEGYYKKLIDFFLDKDILSKTFFVEYEGKSIAGAVVLVHDDTAYYIHGAMDRDYKNLMAPYFLHWEIMKWAKNHGLVFYDFWGIDARKWSGVTRFKLGWGGNTVEYPGSFDFPVNRSRYWAYRIVRKIF